MAVDPGIVTRLILTAHEALDEGVVMGNGDRVLHVNEAACRLYGRTRDELLSRSLFRFLTSQEQERIEQVMADAMAAGAPVPQRFETVIARPDGSEAAVEMSTTALVDGSEVRTLTIIRDIGESLRQRAELERLALHDPLTGLPNRRLLMERLERASTRAEREPISAALYFLDLDGLKPINDEHGHDSGDQVLAGVARSLRDGLRSCDSVARLGGDEFVVLCERIADDAAAEALVLRLKRLVGQPIAVGSGALVSMDVSVGVHRLSGRFDSEAVLAEADQAMYREKAARSATAGGSRSRPPRGRRA